MPTQDTHDIPAYPGTIYASGVKRKKSMFVPTVIIVLVLGIGGILGMVIHAAVMMPHYSTTIHYTPVATPTATR